MLHVTRPWAPLGSPTQLSQSHTTKSWLTAQALPTGNCSQNTCRSRGHLKNWGGHSWHDSLTTLFYKRPFMRCLEGRASCTVHRYIPQITARIRLCRLVRSHRVPWLKTSDTASPFFFFLLRNANNCLHWLQHAGKIKTDTLKWERSTTAALTWIWSSPQLYLLLHEPSY